MFATSYGRTWRSRAALGAAVALLLALSAQRSEAQEMRRAAAAPVTGGSTAPNPLIQVEEAIREIEMFAGETRIVPTPGVGRVAVGNGKILSASVLDERELLLIANDPGTTTIHTWHRDGRVRRLRVAIRPGDMARTTREILDFLGDMQNVRARAVGDKVLVEGQDLSDEQLFKIEELAKRYPQIVNFTARLGWERMVVMDVKVVEFKKDKLRELGIRWATGTSGPNVGVAGDIINNNYYYLRPNDSDLGFNGLSDLRPRVSPFQWYFGLVSALSSRINVYERNGDAVVLAEPQLTARSGSSAKFQSGGEIPYAVVTGLGQVNIQFKNYGIILEIKPRADSKGTIRSEILAEVSEPDPTLSPANGVPGLRTRRTQTEFNVRSGETMVLSGLLDRRKGETIEQIPGLGNIPIIGHLFKSKRFVNNETELVIFVTPVVMSPDDAKMAEMRRRAMEQAEQFLNDKPAADKDAKDDKKPKTGEPQSSWDRMKDRLGSSETGHANTLYN